nr:unnamed protein product [Callosobruchus analis]
MKLEKKPSMKDYWRQIPLYKNTYPNTCSGKGLSCFSACFTCQIMKNALLMTGFTKFNALLIC